MALTETQPPASCAIAFKEWSGICRALAEGRQSILLRKGGIAEDGGAFRPEHDAFWLYPTSLHEGQQGLKAGSPPMDSPATPGVVPLDLLAVVNDVRWVDRVDELDALDPLHAWTAETVRKRFEYRSPGLWVLAIRAYRIPVAHRIEVSAEHEGCKTWVPLGRDLDARGARPVLGDEVAEAASGAVARVGRGSRP